MNYGMDRICQLDASQKGTFIHPANRIIRARMQMHDRYHEHPTQPDLIAEFEAIVAWGIITCSYSGVEQAIKCLLQMRGISTGKKSGRHHHSIGKLFRELAPEEQNVLRHSYAIYRSLHSYIPPETADAFLDAIDNGYEIWRYFLLEGKRPPTTHPGAMLEIWSALTDILQARTFTNHGIYTVKRRLDTHLCNRQSRAFREDGENSEHWPAMVERLESQNVHINYYADLIYRGAHQLDVADDERATLHALLDGENKIDIDNDFRHFLERAQTIKIVWNEHEGQFEATGQAIE